MDELALVKQFRLEDADPDGARTYARAALERATSRARVRRRWTVALAFVVAAAVVGSAYGIVRDLIVGDPPPAEIKRAIARVGHEVELIPMPRQAGDPIVEDARVVAVLDSPVGRRVYLFGTRSDRGGCAWLWIEGDRGYQGRPSMTSACGESSKSFWAQAHVPLRGRQPAFFFGRARPQVARMTIRLDDRTMELPLFDGWFMAEIDAAELHVTAYDADGHELEHEFEWPFGLPSVPSGPSRDAPANPVPVGRAHEVLRIEARGGTKVIRLDVSRSSDGGACMFVRSKGTRTNRGCGRWLRRPGPRKIEMSPMQYGGAPGGDQLLIGRVGRDVVRLRVRFQDGRVARVPLNEGWAMYEVRHRDWREGRRPAELIGLDAAGKVVARALTPWG